MGCGTLKIFGSQLRAERLQATSDELFRLKEQKYRLELNEVLLHFGQGIRW